MSISVLLRLLRANSKHLHALLFRHESFPTLAAKPSITGSLALSGALSGTFSWKPDLALTCTCVPGVTPPIGRADVTMTNGTGTFIAVTAMTKGDGQADQRQAQGGVAGPGKTGTCLATGPSALTGKLTVPIDVTVADKGESVTIKGNLPANCP